MEVVMPNYKGHIAGGCIAYGIFLMSLRTLFLLKPTPLASFEWFLCTLAGALFPDIDTKSKGQKYFYWIIFGLLLMFFYKKQWHAFPIMSFILVFPMLSRHRGLFHTLWFIIAMPLGIWFFLYSMHIKMAQLLFFDVVFFIAGAISHVWLDVGLRRMLALR
jgi:hypothetical protein